MKVQITRETRGFGGAVQTVTEIIYMPEGAELPEGAVVLQDEEEEE